MTLTHRAGLTVAVVILLALGTTPFAPPTYNAAFAQRGGFRPPSTRPPTPPVRPPTLPPATGRPPGSFSGGSRTGITTPGSFSGGTRLPIMPPRTPVEITTTLRKTAETSPVTAIREMRIGEGRNLPDATRVTLSREVAQRLAARVESARDPVAALNEVRAVRAEVGGLPEAVRRPIDRLHETTRRRVLNEAIDQVRAEMDAGRWAAATVKASLWEGRLRAVTPYAEGAAITAQHAEVQAACKSLVDLGARANTLEKFSTALEGKTAARELSAIDPTRLPEPLRRPQEVLRGLAELNEAAATRWTKAPDVRALKDTLARVERVAFERPDVDPNLAKRLATDLAIKALIDGHAPEFFKLLPGEVPPEHAAQALRDLKALALGEGKVEGWPAAKAAGEAGAGPAGPRPPPGLEPLIPEGNKAGWRPPTSEKGTAGLPSLEKANEAGAKVREGAKAKVQAERAKLDGEAATARKALADTQARVMAPEAAERKRFTTVEYRLDRRLTPLERTKVRDWLDDGRSPDEFLKELKDEAGDDDERFLREVVRLLGRPLSDAERQQARRLRREGRRPVEVAELLRS